MALRPMSQADLSSMLSAVGLAGRHRLALLRGMRAGCPVIELHAPCMAPAWQHFGSWASMACPPAGQALSGLPAAAALLRTQHGQHQRSKLWPPMQQAWQHASAQLERDEEQQPAPVPKAAAAGDAVALRGTTASPVTISGVLSPADTYGKAIEMGTQKASLPAWKTFSMALLAGAYVGFGGFLAMSIGANCPELAASNPGLQKIIFGAFGLPLGLTMVVVCGAELFTSNAAMLPVAWYEGKVSQLQVLRNWALAYSGNLLGSLALVGLVVASGVFTEATAAGPMALAEYKCHHTWLQAKRFFQATALPLAGWVWGEGGGLKFMSALQAFTRGILCNWLVCLAVWQANAAQTLGGKFIGIFLPISAFVAIGLEHSIANCFLLPCGMALGANITTWDILFNNLIPVTLGNTLAGTFLVGGSYSLAYGALGRKLQRYLSTKS